MRIQEKGTKRSLSTADGSDKRGWEQKQSKIKSKIHFEQGR
jgi:hypothetical protein